MYISRILGDSQLVKTLRSYLPLNVLLLPAAHNKPVLLPYPYREVVNQWLITPRGSPPYTRYMTFHCRQGMIGHLCHAIQCRRSVNYPSSVTQAKLLHDS